MNEHVAKSVITDFDANLSVVKDDGFAALYSRYYNEGEKIRPEAIEENGYRFTVRHLTIARRYKLYELLPLNSDQPAQICFLSPSHRLPGVFIAGSFLEHKARLFLQWLR